MDWGPNEEEKRKGDIKKIVKIAFISLIVLVGLSLLSLVLKVVFFPLNIANKTIDMVNDAADKVLDADRALFEYEWFKQQYEDYQAIQEKIKTAEKAAATFKEEAGDRKNWTFEDKNEYSRLNTIVEGIKFQLEDVKSKYNAKSKMLSRNLFKDKALPYQLE